MDGLSLSVFFGCMVLFSFGNSSHAVDTLFLNQSIADGEFLVSSGQTFELGFFAPSSRDSQRRYLGIWYKNSPDVVVWIANRKNRLTDSSGVLTLTGEGKLVLLSGTKNVIWSSNPSKNANNLAAQILDSGNLVIREKGSSMAAENYVWQSFDYPSNTMLAGMKMGWNLKTRLNRYFSSWKDESDPSPGDFTYGLELVGLPQVVLRQGLAKKYRTGPWNGLRFSGADILPNGAFKPKFVIEPGELYYSYEPGDDSTVTRLLLTPSGSLQRYALNPGTADWSPMYSLPSDQCDKYKRCGPNGICRSSKMSSCDCIDGFIPKSQREWDRFNWTRGCVRRTPLECVKGEGFITLSNLKLPDLVEFWLNKSMTLKECEAECLKSCSCTAFANSDITEGGGNGCLIWFGDLIDIREFKAAEGPEQEIHLRMPASELDHKKGKLVLIVATTTTVVLLIFASLTWFIMCKRKKKRGFEANKEHIDLPLFDLRTMETATDNFSWTNVIGEGGFGPVYKGKLSTGQEIAVKRLSRVSGQGVEEFKNEIILIARLQHRNLVRLLGCCLEGEERILVYEYMPNKSLDYFIFDRERRVELSWPRRFEIAVGVARGLLYLHQDSRLRIIHRDLKASNVLLDNELNPKISDFGIARIIGGDQIEGKTKRIIGTYGYMSPEYAIAGKFSVKSDVFSLGVLVLEIVSGHKNMKFQEPNHNLMGNAWRLWNEGKALDLVDECLEDSYVESQVLRCIQVGLLCVQQHPEHRPTMSSVVFMLCNEDVALAQPRQPGYFIETDNSTFEEGFHTGNSLTMTLPLGR